MSGITSQHHASDLPVRDAMEVVLKTLFFLHTHWGRIGQGGEDGPSLKQIAILAYHVRGILYGWMADGGAAEAPELFPMVEATRKQLDALHWAFFDASGRQGAAAGEPPAAEEGADEA